jgi:hypothetical protein
MGPQPVLARFIRGKPPHYNGCVPKLATTRSSSMVHCLAQGCYWQGSTATLAASVSLSTRRLPLQPVPITACISLRMMTSRKPCGRCEALWPRLIVSIISCGSIHRSSGSQDSRLQRLWYTPKPTTPATLTTLTPPFHNSRCPQGAASTAAPCGQHSPCLFIRLR